MALIVREDRVHPTQGARPTPIDVVHRGRVVAETQPAQSAVRQAGSDHRVTFTKGEGAA
jgi:hypothetical protein